MLTVLTWIWAAPVTLLGLIACPFLGPYGAHWHRGVLEIDVRRAPFLAWTMGRVVMYKHGRRDSRPHEMVHVWQCSTWGPLMLLLYPVASLSAWVQSGFSDWYTGNYFESQARRLAGKKGP